MDKKLKKKFTAFPTSLYDKEWVEKAADEGLEEFIETWNETQSVRLSKDENKSAYHMIAFLYYSAFESALQTFFQQVLEDSITDISLCMTEMCKVVAEIKERSNDEKRD